MDTRSHLTEDEIVNSGEPFVGNETIGNSEVSDASAVAKDDNKKYYIAWGIIGALILIFLGLDYMKVSLGILDMEFSGYKFISVMKSSITLNGMLALLLVITAVAIVITAALGFKGGILNNSIIKIMMMSESIAGAIITIVEFFCFKHQIAEGAEATSYATMTLGVGCYLNILVTVIAVVLYFWKIRMIEDEEEETESSDL